MWIKVSVFRDRVREVKPIEELVQNLAVHLRCHCSALAVIKSSRAQEIVWEKDASTTARLTSWGSLLIL